MNLASDAYRDTRNQQASLRSHPASLNELLVFKAFLPDRRVSVQGFRDRVPEKWMRVET